MTESQVGRIPEPHMNDKLHTHAAQQPAMGPNRKPTPYPCLCGEPSCYGLGGVWYCGACWQVEWEKGRTV